MTEQKPQIARLIALLLGPLLAIVLLWMPVPAGMTPEAWRLIAVTLWMVIWWLSEALPLSATALLPIVIFPALGIQPTGEVSRHYGNHLIFLFLGGFILAAGMQRWGVHRRIALAIVAAVGSSPSRIIMGFMLATAFLSMWISNTATAVMMYAVGVSIIDFIDERVPDKTQVDRFGIGLMLSIAYSASIGGVGTLIGTPPNALLASLLSENYGIEIDFFTWMLIGIPVVIVMLPPAYLLLTRVLFPVHEMELSSVQRVIAEERALLGPMKTPERRVAMIFAGAAFLWITRSFLGLPIDDSGVAILAALALFALPAERGAPPLLDWSVSRDLPWGVLLLFGGGLAIAGGFEASGLALWIGEQVGQMGDVPLWLLVLIVAVAIKFLTEITSNTASTATFLPVLGAVALGLDVSVLWLTVPVALGASMAFMMPAATPPNSIIFSYEKLTLKHMVKAGFALNILSTAVVFFASWWLMPLVFGL
jgi:sodium-dependent dicarboxylate transporter 2/3/5